MSASDLQSFVVSGAYGIACGGATLCVEIQRQGVLAAGAHALKLKAKAPPLDGFAIVTQLLGGGADGAIRRDGVKALVAA